MPPLKLQSLTDEQKQKFLKVVSDHAKLSIQAKNQEIWALPDKYFTFSSSKTIVVTYIQHVTKQINVHNFHDQMAHSIFNYNPALRKNLLWSKFYSVIDSQSDDVSTDL
jgi:hypothetical protein